MIIKIKDKVKLKNDVSFSFIDDRGDNQEDKIPAGTEGEVSNIVVIGDEKLILFHPEGGCRIYAVSVDSVTTMKADEKVQAERYHQQAFDELKSK